MTKRQYSKTASRKRNCQLGFTFVEVLMAIVILLVGIVAVAQLVPASISSNSTNRNDSSALVFAQREMDQFLRQPLNMSLIPPAFIDAEGFSCNLGDPTQPNVVVGSPVATFYNQLVIDFTQSTVPGYSFIYQDPNDPAGINYDVRWAVITVTNNGMVSSKRFIMGARREGGNGIYRPVTIDTILEK
ncbi:MAG: prepilin-type N-terminal cleavage/methylation domain-containing protein [Candidatus Acidiferrum sp.]|jgi:prepilin-type N-terminal cleavage/methylation domain-containing protein